MLKDEEYDSVYKKVKKCHDIFANHNVDNLTKMKLMELALPPTVYYKMDSIHLRTPVNKLAYKNYDVNSSCMVFIGICAETSGLCYHCTEYVQV